MLRFYRGRVFGAGAALAAAALLAACSDADPSVQPTATVAPTEPTPAEIATAADPTASPSETAEATQPSETAQPTEPTPTAEPTQPGETLDAVTVVTVEVADGVVSAPDRVEVGLGGPVRVEITSDAHDEVHVHGYDLEAQLEPGQTAVIEFTADIPGIFEVELHHGGQELFQLRVQ